MDGEDTRPTIARVAVDPAALTAIRNAYAEYQAAVAAQLRVDPKMEVAEEEDIEDEGVVAEAEAASAESAADDDDAANAGETAVATDANNDGEITLDEFKDKVVSDIEDLAAAEAAAAAEAFALANPAPIFEAGTEFDAMLAVVGELLEAYLAPVLDQLSPVLLSVADPEEKVSIVLSADATLLDLPLEGLALARAPEVKSITRDFSLGMFCSRLNGTSDGQEGGASKIGQERRQKERCCSDRTSDGSVCSVRVCS